MSESAAIVKVRCPACNKKLGFPQTSAGKKAKCPGCQEVFRVEIPESAAAIPAPATPHPPAAATGDQITVHCPSCQKKLRLPSSAAGRSARCPACQEKFPVVAASAPAHAPVPASPPDDDNALFDLLADAEKSSEALEVQPDRPADFAARELKPLKPDAQVQSGGRAGSSAEPIATRMEKAYSAMGTLAKGCMLSAAGALIGAFIWYFIAKTTGYEIGYVAWALGGLTGVGMHIGIRNESLLAGGLAALFALGGIIAAKLMYIAWVFLPEMEAEHRAELGKLENQREVLVEQETEKIYEARKIDPDEATEAQDEAVTTEAEKRIAKLSEKEVRARYDKYAQEHPEASAGLSDAIKEVPTGFLVLFVGLMFGFKGLIFAILGMATAFKVGYNGGSFGES